MALFPVSAVTGKGVEELKHAMAERVEEVRQLQPAVRESVD